MAGTEAPEMTPEERLKNWQMIKSVIDHRAGTISRKQAINRMAYFSGLLPGVCEIMLSELSELTLPELQKEGERVRITTDIVHYRRQALSARKKRDLIMRSAPGRKQFPHRPYVRKADREHLPPKQGRGPDKPDE